MAGVLLDQTSFVAGEISPDMFERRDTVHPQSGAERVRNMVTVPQGGVVRRAGLEYLATITGATDGAKLATFEFSTDQVYLIIFTDLVVTVYRDDAEVFTGASPYTSTELAEIDFTQAGDVMIVVHKDHPIRKLERQGADTSWAFSELAFDEDTGGNANQNGLRQPYRKFLEHSITITPSATTGAGITLTASDDVFVDAHVGEYFQINRVNLKDGKQPREVEITAVASATSATATVRQTLFNTNATKNWKEPAFSGVRGYPRTVTFHEDRLVFGGSRDAPDTIFASKTGLPFNFEVGDSLDDEAIEFTLGSDQINEIRNIYSLRDLLIFTTDAEFAQMNSPMTPSAISAVQQTRWGSLHIRPESIEGAAIFVDVGRAGARHSIVELLFSDVQQAYATTNLSLLASHLINEPVDMDMRRGRTDIAANHLFVINSAANSNSGIVAGSCAVLNTLRSQEITGWTLFQTDGEFVNVAVVGGAPYFLIKRAINGSTVFYLEKSTTSFRLDSAKLVDSSGSTAATPETFTDDMESYAVIGDAVPTPYALLTEQNGTVALEAGVVHAGSQGLDFSVTTTAGTNKALFSYKSMTLARGETLTADFWVHVPSGSDSGRYMILDIEDSTTAGSPGNRFQMDWDTQQVIWNRDKLTNIDPTIGPDVYKSTTGLPEMVADAWIQVTIVLTIGEGTAGSVSFSLDGTEYLAVSDDTIVSSLSNFNSFQFGITSRINVAGKVYVDDLTFTKVPLVAAGLTHLEGETVHAIADGVFMGAFVVSDGEIVLGRDADEVEVGLPFSWQLVPMPPNFQTDNGTVAGQQKRVASVTIGYLNSAGISVRLWGLTPEPDAFRIETQRFGEGALDQPAPLLTGYDKVRLLGASRTGQVELFGDDPLDVHIRSVVTEVGI